MPLDRPRLRGDELENAIAERKSLMESANLAAMHGDPICGGLFALLESHPLAHQASDFADYDDEDDDEIRPY